MHTDFILRERERKSNVGFIAIMINTYKVDALFASFPLVLLHVCGSSREEDGLGMRTMEILSFVF